MSGSDSAISNATNCYETVVNFLSGKVDFTRTRVSVFVIGLILALAAVICCLCGANAFIPFALGVGVGIIFALILLPKIRAWLKPPKSQETAVNH